MPEMTREQRDKAVAIAKDAIGQILAPQGGYRMENEIYLRIEAGEPIDATKDLRDYLSVPGAAPCRVCQLGAMLASKSRCFGGVPVQPFMDDYMPERLNLCCDDVRGELSDIFDERTMDLLESAFECQDMSVDGGSDDEIERAIAFGERFDSEKELAIAICQNLIENDGEFVP